LIEEKQIYGAFVLQTPRLVNEVIAGFAGLYGANTSLKTIERPSSTAEGRSEAEL
jgi:hypothetical protein